MRATLILLTGLCGLSGQSMAEESWSYTGTFYGWLPGITTTVETPLGEVESEVEFSDILDKLDFAFLAAFEAQNGRLSLVGDLQFYNLGASATPNLPSIANAPSINEVDIDSKVATVGGYALYAVAESPNTRFEIGGGLRYFDAEIDTLVSSQQEISVQAEGNWVDGVLSARVTHAFNADWFSVLYADVGGFGISESSDLTVAAHVTAGYRFNDGWSALAGYRYLGFERDFNGRTITSDVGGPVIAIEKQF